MSTCPKYAKLEVLSVIDVCWPAGMGGDPPGFVGGGGSTVTRTFSRTDTLSASVAPTVMVAVPHCDGV